jgi:hypothetical protein
MSTCVDVVAPFDFERPESTPLEWKKFPLLPMCEETAVFTFDDDNDVDDELSEPAAPQVSTRACETDAIPRYLKPQPPLSNLTVTADYVKVDSQRAVGKPTQIKIIEWKAPSKDRSSEFPGVTTQLQALGAKIQERTKHSQTTASTTTVTNSKRKQKNNIDDYESEDSLPLHVRVRHAYRGTVSDDSVDPLSCLNEVEQADHDMVRLLTQMEDF